MRDIHPEIQKIYDEAKALEKAYTGPGRLDLHDWRIERVLALKLPVDRSCPSYYRVSGRHAASAWSGDRGYCCYCGGPGEYINPTWGVS